MKGHTGKIIIGIILFVLIIVIIYAYFFINDFLKDEKETKKLMGEIVESYHDFSKIVSNISDDRNKIYDLKDKMMLLESSNEYAKELSNTISDYQKLRQTIEDKSLFLKENCKTKYASKKVNNVCEVFKQEYEAAYNYYITDIDVYNKVIDKYNEYVKQNQLKWDLLNLVDLKDNNKYIDYDKDGNILGGKNEKE